MVEGSLHLHKHKAGHVDDDTRWTLRKAWEGLGREPEPWMRAEKDRNSSPGRGVAAAACARRFAPARLAGTRRRCSRRRYGSKVTQGRGAAGIVITWMRWIADESRDSWGRNLPPSTVLPTVDGDD